MKTSIVVPACLFVGVIIGMIVGFTVQQGQISELKQQLIAHNKSLNERIDDVVLQFVRCKHCNSTAYSDSSSYDDQELRMKLENIAAAQTEIWS
jgi:hypothetical protein